ncbi:MAG: hypothetical protein Q9214_001487 [Letrouitia sp. 1 TL-2023]
MWRLLRAISSFQLWFSDGEPINSTRGISNTSSRLIVDTQGFLDLTDLNSLKFTALDANGLLLLVHGPPFNTPSSQSSYLAELFLTIVEDGGFQLSVTQPMAAKQDIIDANWTGPATTVTGKLKPFPDVSNTDADILKSVIKAKYVPYQALPDVPGKTADEIKALGQRLFPFTPHNFELAMSVYDWTTPSFVRLVYLKIFQYTSIKLIPSPLDLRSIAQRIYATNWSTYSPHNPDFMNSFMMLPASSLRDVQAQLDVVAPMLHESSDAQNRLIAAAMQAMPRASSFAHAQLFSGQMDIRELGFDYFGIEFLECPLNAGPVGQPLIQAFETALASYVSIGKIITTKMIWSFTDTVEDALHYSNGIVIVAKHLTDSVVWNTASYITPLSDDPTKVEYTFPPGSKFKILNIDTITYHGKKIVVIELQPLDLTPQGAIQKSYISEEIKKEMLVQSRWREVM